jgi:hypothetical protein
MKQVIEHGPIAELCRRLDAAEARWESGELISLDPDREFAIFLPAEPGAYDVLYRTEPIGWVEGWTITGPVGIQGPQGSPLTWMQMGRGDRHLRKRLLPLFLDRGWSVQRDPSSVRQGLVAYHAAVETACVEAMEQELRWLAQQTTCLELQVHLGEGGARC